MLVRSFFISSPLRYGKFRVVIARNIISRSKCNYNRFLPLIKQNPYMCLFNILFLYSKAKSIALLKITDDLTLFFVGGKII